MSSLIRLGVFGLALMCACVPTFADEKPVGSVDEINAAMKSARPGDVFIMNDGEWKDALIKVTARGTKDQPITLRARTPGKVQLLGKSSIVLAGDHCVVSGVFFGESTSTDPAVAFTGNDNRFTDSAIIAQDRGGKWVHFQKGQRNRIDHCYLEGHRPVEPTVQVEIEEHQPSEARIDHNHFGPRPPLGKNGGETMRVGYSWAQNRVAKTLVEHNLFDRCDGEIEIISSKSTDSTYRYNTFRDCDGTLTLRHGGKCTVEGNFFVGREDGKSGGVRVIGAGHRIVNNYFENVGPSAGGVIALTSGMREPKPVDYQHVDGGLIAFNTIVNSGLPYVRTDAGFAPDRERDVLPKNLVVMNNLFVAGESAARSEAKTFVHGRVGDGYAWTGNIAHGATVGGGNDVEKGFRTIDPKLTGEARNGMLRPSSDSAVLEAAVTEASNHLPREDIEGQRRDDKPDVGADERSDEPPTNRPLVAGDVGPSWKKPSGGGAAGGLGAAKPASRQ